MKHLPRTPWKKFLDSLRHRVEESLERMADVIKDAILDWEVGMDAAAERLPLEELPPMAPARFVEAMRDKVDAILWSVAEAINDAPTGHIVAASEEQIGKLLEELWCEALRQGVQQRIDAAQSGLRPSQRLQGEWAKRLHRMTVAGASLPSSHRTLH